MKKTKKHAAHKHTVRKLQKTSSPSLVKFLLFFIVLTGLLIYLDRLPTLTPQPHRNAIVKAASFAVRFPKSLLPIIPTPPPSSAAVGASPSPTLIPEHMQEQPGKNDYCIDVPIIYYHHIEPLDQAKKEGHGQLTVDSTIFESQVQYLVANGYHMITASDVVDAIRNHTSLPPKSIVLTFDDGYSDIYQYAYPIFKKYNVSADLEIPTGLLENPDYLTWNQLKEMAGNPLIHVYNHTWSHAALGILPKDKIQFEVNTDEQQLQDHLGVKPLVLVYPYGSFSPLAEQTLEELGYTGGLSTIGGREQCESYIMALHRTEIGNAPLSYYGL